MFSIKYNRTTNHIAGIAERTVSNQSAENANRYGAVAYYAENACGSLTRYRFADGASFESLAEALEAARKAGGRKLCKTCEKAAEAALAAMQEAAEPKTEESQEVTEIAPENSAEPRIKFKVNRILGSSIVTDEDGTKSFRMIVDESVRGPVGLIFTEDEALWLFADIMDRQKEFRAWQAEAGE
jgi:hypothetical protein